MVKKSDDTAKTFSCRNCGHPYTVYPPDSSYSYAYLTPCQVADSDPSHNFKTKFECDNCNFANELFWCGGHIFTT
jgi:predicted RNA-binding Zn-ribbon protein involved in translation (DUF1610 family)